MNKFTRYLIVSKSEREKYSLLKSRENIIVVGFLHIYHKNILLDYYKEQ